MATSEKIALNNVRLSFPRLFKAKSFQEGQEPRFEAAFLLDPSNKDHAKTIKLIESTAKELLTEHFGKTVPKGVKNCFGLSEDAGKEYDGYADMFFITSSNRQRPVVVNRDRTPVTEEDGVIYAGCYVNANVTLWVQDNQFGKRVNANLRSVQFVKDGEAFGVEPVVADEEFEELDEDSEKEDYLD